MLQRNLISALAVSVALVVLPSCGDDGGDDGAEVDASTDGTATSTVCEALDGMQYESVDQHECGRGPNGPLMCHWQISFADGRFNWSYSDVMESGPYTCDGNTITAGQPNRDYTGTIDPATGRLTWQGIEYQIPSG